MEKIKTRFAPSPTGLLHIGGARTAVFNWALARKDGGVFLLRIEDTDRERSSPEFEKAILEDLRWLGIDWDEGPYRQSERLEVYRAFFSKLKEKNHIYPCYCTPEELQKEREQALRSGKPPRYSGRCFFLSAEERKKREAEGRLPSFRFRIPSLQTISFTDLVRGKVVFHTASLGDFVVLRSDGIPTYNFACVVDDALMGISHVLRGEEHLSNTPYQILLYEALGFPLPCFAHVPIILDENRAKLSKRRGDT
ncbi:MAG: glutamate--tRNA ligase, partial [Candidatus Caldatribacteriaceae bacterium]